MAPIRTISSRLILGFASVLALLIGLALVSISKVNTINADLATVSDVNSVKQRYAINFRGSVHDRAISLRDVSLVSNSSELRAALADIERLTSNYAKSAELLDAMMAARMGVTPDEVEILASIKATERRTLPLISEVVRLQQAADPVQARAVLMEQARPAFVEWLARINQFIDLEEQKNKTVAANARGVAEGFQTFMLALCAAAVAFGAAVAWWSVRSIRPLRELTINMRALADGNLGVAVPSTERSDEIGAVARAVQVFKANAEANQRLETEGAVQRQRQAARVSAVDSRIRAFEDDVARLLASLGGATTELTQTSKAMSDTAERTSHQAQAATSGSTQTSSNVEAVATAAERLSGSIVEVMQQISNSATIADKATDQVRQTDVTVRELTASVQQIGDVVGLIRTIAGQTNLLALNATIEAARAGEHGKGFAVVASEVKALALQTARATEDIAKHIAAVQASSEQAVAAIHSIGATITQVNETAGSVVMATEQQAAATAEITRSVLEAARGTRGVSDNIKGVSGGADATRTASERVSSAAEAMRKQADALRGEVGQFLADLRAA